MCVLGSETHIYVVRTSKSYLAKKLSMGRLDSGQDVWTADVFQVKNNNWKNSTRWISDASTEMKKWNWQKEKKLEVSRNKNINHCRLFKFEKKGNIVEINCFRFLTAL